MPKKTDGKSMGDMARKAPIIYEAMGERAPERAEMKKITSIPSVPPKEYMLMLTASTGIFEIIK